MPFLKTVVLPLFLLSFIVFSCAEDSSLQDINSSDYAQMDLQEHTTVEAPGIIPPDIAYHEISLSKSSTWKDYHDFYLHNILIDKDVHYFDNLQWASISDMIRSTKYLEEAPIDVKKFYVKETFSRSYINEPAIAISLLQDALQNKILSPKEVGEYAETVEQRNQDRLSEESLKIHMKRHGKDYAMLSMLAGLGK